jgi:hypothetical protein
LGETAKLREKFLQGVSAGFRYAERRNLGAATQIEVIDIVDESDAPDCCRQFPHFPHFPLTVFQRARSIQSGTASHHFLRGFRRFLGL